MTSTWIRFGVGNGAHSFVQHAQIKDCRREGWIGLQRMPEFLARLFKAGFTAALQIGNSEIIVDVGTRADFLLSQLEIVDGAFEVLLNQIEPSHFMAVC